MKNWAWFFHFLAAMMFGVWIFIFCIIAMITSQAMPVLSGLCLLMGFLCFPAAILTARQMENY